MSLEIGESPCAGRGAFPVMRWHCLRANRRIHQDVFVVDEQDIIETYWYYRKDKISASGTEGSGAGNATAELGEEILSGIAAELIKWVEGALKEDMPKPHK